MKNKKLAILLSAAMAVTSLQTGGLMAYAEDFSAEDFVSEDSFTDELVEDEAEMENSAEAENDGFSSEADAAEEFYSDSEEETTNELVTEDAGSDIAINEGNFPDKYFREYVAYKFDTNKDGVLSNTEIAAATTMNDLYGEDITSLKGIEYFTNLQYLDCGECTIDSLDVSHNTALVKLSCYLNDIEELDVSHNVNLEILYCGDNKFTELDVSKNTKLKELDCCSLNLKNLDVSNNPELTYLDCSRNQLTALNLTNNNKITTLKCSYNPSLAKLDVHNMAGLEVLQCDDDGLSTLDVTYNSKLRTLSCVDNKLKVLDLSANPELIELECRANQLVSLNLKNQPLLGLDEAEGNWELGRAYDQTFYTSVSGDEAKGWNLDLEMILGNENLSKIKTIGSTTSISGEDDSDSRDSAYVKLKDGTLNWPYAYKAQYIYLLMDTGYTGKYYRDVNLEIVLGVSYKENQTPALEDENFVYENNEDGTVAVIKYKGQGKDVVIPETFEGKRVTQIRSGEGLGAYGVFAGKDIVSVKMPSIELVGFCAFSQCSSLKTVYMLNVKNLGLSAFSESGITSVDAPLLTWISPYAFSNCSNLTSVNMPELAGISQYGFYGCKNLKEFTSTNKITTLVSKALSNTGLTSIKLYGNVDIQGDQVFGYYEEENGNRVPVPGFKVYGEKETTVETYAKTNGFEFVEINPQPVTCAHQWEEITEPATCSKEGLTYKKCKLCGEKEEGSEKKLPKTSHKTSIKNQKNATCTAKGYTGDKICSTCGATVEKGKEIPAAGHKYGAYKVTKAATIFATGTETRECSVCKKQESRAIAKLASYVKLSTGSLPVQVKKSVSAKSLIAGMKSGDSISSLKTSNAKVAAVNNKTFKITAKKAGKATITVTMKSGASAKVTVTVKNSKIATTKITGVQKTVTLKKGKKLTLKPVLNPITSGDKVTYTSSNKKIATVSSKGVIKAMKKGKATIKVKAGKKTVTCKVTVK